MNEQLIRFFESTYYIGGLALLVWIASGIAMGIAQTALKRATNVWPLQITAILLTISTMIVLASMRLLNTYLAIATITSPENRSMVLLNAFNDAFIILRFGLAGTVLQIITASIGRMTFINGNVQWSQVFSKSPNTTN
jgi:hypothetical protein